MLCKPKWDFRRKKKSILFLRAKRVEIWKTPKTQLLSPVQKTVQTVYNFCHKAKFL